MVLCEQGIPAIIHLILECCFIAVITKCNYFIYVSTCSCFSPSLNYKMHGGEEASLSFSGRMWLIYVDSQNCLLNEYICLLSKSLTVKQAPLPRRPRYAFKWAVEAEGW